MSDFFTRAMGECLQKDERYFIEDWAGKIDFCAERRNILCYLAQKMTGKQMDLQRTRISDKSMVWKI